MLNLPFITIGIPTLNEEARISKCLDAIAKLNYPKNKLEIVIADGGSSDNTIKIAKKYGCKILENKKKLAEVGLSLIYKKARGDYMVFMAADNILFDKKWLRKMIIPFVENSNEIYSSFSKVINDPKDNIWNKFMNEDTDPFSSFVFGNASHPDKFQKKYKKEKETRDYIVYDYPVKDFPLIALAQGTMLKTGLGRKKESEDDDILPLIKVIESGKKIAYVKTTGLYHYSVLGFNNFRLKFKKRIYNSINTNSYLSREKYVSKKRKIRRYLFLFFSFTIIPVFIYSIYLCIQKRKIYMLLFLPTSLTISYYIVYNYLNIKLWRK